MATIHTMQELADHIGANEPTEESMSHRIYKDTRCGAWLAFYKGERATLLRPATWDVEMIDTPAGIVCVRGCSVTADEYVTPDRFPYELQTFLNLSLGDDTRHYVCKGDPDLVCVAEIPETDRVHRMDDANTWRILFDTWQVTEPSDEVIGVSVGSIVEGATCDTSIYTLEFPFEMSDFWAQLQDVEDEASEIWDATHDAEGNELAYDQRNPFYL